MRRPPHSIVLVACLSLLTLQLSGLHMHVNAQGYAGTPQGMHVHGQSMHRHGDTHLDGGHGGGQEHSGDQDHEGDRDVSVVELSAGQSKWLTVVVWLGLTLLLILTPGVKLSASFVVPRLTVRRVHWRPPLRAPPPLSC